MCSQDYTGCAGPGPVSMDPGVSSRIVHLLEDRRRTIAGKRPRNARVSPRRRLGAQAPSSTCHGHGPMHRLHVCTCARREPRPPPARVGRPVQRAILREAEQLWRAPAWSLHVHRGQTLVVAVGGGPAAVKPPHTCCPHPMFHARVSPPTWAFPRNQPPVKTPLSSAELSSKPACHVAYMEVPTLREGPSTSRGATIERYICMCASGRALHEVLESLALRKN